MANAIVCPQCNRAGNIPDAAIGHTIKCAKCGARFKVANAGPQFADPAICTIPYEAIADVSVEGITTRTDTKTGHLGLVVGGLFLVGGSRSSSIHKQEKFLKLDFMDDTNTRVSAVFRKSIGCGMPTLCSRILQRRHDWLKQIQDTSTAQAIAGPATAHSPSDIAETIEKLARLRDQGVLSEDEFQAKKQELLSRL